jgi:hypothetical protein
VLHPLARNSGRAAAEEQDVEPTIPGGVELIALHRRPEDVSSLLPPAERSRVQILTREPVDIGSASLHGGAAAESVVTLPIDGPVGAVELAVAGLFRTPRATIAAPSNPNGEPTGWWVLDLLARYTTPAVDVRAVRWLDEEGLWWTHPTGPVHLPLVVTGHASSMTAARVLHVAEAVRPSEPVTDWLAAASADARPTAVEWEALLCARYLSMALEHIERRQPARQSPAATA